MLNKKELNTEPPGLTLQISFPVTPTFIRHPYQSPCWAARLSLSCPGEHYKGLTKCLAVISIHFIHGTLSTNPALPGHGERG